MDAFDSANLKGKLQSGDFLQISAALTALVGQVEGYLRQIGEFQPPAIVSESAELKIAEQRSATKVLQLLQRLRAAVQAGNAAEIQQIATQIDGLGTDPEVTRPTTLQQSLLSRFNIPDIEVNYRRP